MLGITTSPGAISRLMVSLSLTYLPFLFKGLSTAYSLHTHYCAFSLDFASLNLQEADLISGGLLLVIKQLKDTL